MSQDENDRLKSGTLPDDPKADATRVANEVPRVLTVRDIVQGAQQRAFSRRASPGCTSGNYQIDRVTGGLKPGFVWVFGADTSWGKSSALVMIADDNIRRGKRVLIVSSEDSEQIYGDRFLLRRSRVSAENMRRKRLTPDEHSAILDVVAKAEDLPVFFDARGRGVEWIAKKVRELIREHRIDLVAYDYLQAFDNEKPQQDRRNQVSYIARTLTDSVKMSGVSGIIFSQLTVQEGKAHPDKNSIRESRDVSNAAEVVMLGFTPKVPIEDKDGKRLADAGQRCILIDKCKDGPRGGLFVLGWDEISACFDSLPDPEDAQMSQYDDLSDDFVTEERYL